MQDQAYFNIMSQNAFLNDKKGQSAQISLALVTRRSLLIYWKDFAEESLSFTELRHADAWGSEKNDK